MYTKANNSRGKETFGNIFNTYTQYQYPTSREDIFLWGELLWARCGEFSQAMNKIIRYFLVDIQVNSSDSNYKTRKKYKEYLIEDLNILEKAYLLSRDLFLYGNSFVSPYKPFSRLLTCKHCKATFPINKVTYEFDKEIGFRGQCMQCKKNTVYTRTDTKRNDSDLAIIRWDPQDISIDYNELNDTSIYYLEPSDRLHTAISKGERVYLDSLPWTIVECVLAKKKIKLDPTQILHLKYEGIASMISKSGGWGYPPFMAAFDQIVHLHLLKRYNEAIMLDYLKPFRFIAPAKGGGPTRDPLMDIDAGGFMQSVRDMVKAQRKDPTLIHTIPYPVEYHSFGGEAKQLAPVEMIDKAIENLMKTLGIPQEFFISNLQTSGPMIGLRLFERQHASMFSQIEVFLEWMTDQVAKEKMWEDVHVSFTKVSVHEDEATKQMKMDLMGANKVSHNTALSTLGVDYEYEVDSIIEEQAMYEEKIQENARKQEAAAMLQEIMDTPPQPPQDPNAPPEGQGGPPPAGPGGGPPPPAGGQGGGGSIDELHMQAEQLAAELIQDVQNRQSRLIQLKKDDETLHALVKEKIKQMEQQAARTGMNMAAAGQL